MKQLIYAMDTSFYNTLGVYTFQARCEMLQELGYDATYLTLWSPESWQDITRLATAKSEYGLEVAAVYVTADIADVDSNPTNQRIMHLLETIEGCNHIEISVSSSDKTIAPSDPTYDAVFELWLSRCLRIAEQRGLTLSLYHHSHYWLERVEDAVRLCNRILHPRLRIVFSGFHWYNMDGTCLLERLLEAAPFLYAVNICGSRHKSYVPPHTLASTLEPLDDGELDNFVLLGLLNRVGFQGSIGIQGYDVGGDPYIKLKRSLVALRDMQRRLAEHPEWANARLL